MDELTTAIEFADRVRREHNGVMGVFIYLGHDGDNVCRYTDTDGKEVCRGTSGRGLLEAVQRCHLAWEHRVTTLEV